MTRVALKGLATRPLRTFLTALAIVLGVGMVSAAFTLTDTMRGAADSLSSAAYDGTDAVVSARTAFKVDSSSDFTTQKPTIDASVLGKVRSVPQVGTAVGDISDQAQIIGRNGKPLGDGPYFGTGFDARTPGSGKLTAYRLQDGRWAAGPGEVVIDVASAESEHYKLGSTVKINTRGAASPYRVVGLVRFGTVKSLGKATISVFDLATAQTLFHKQGRYDNVLVAGKPGASGTDVRRAVAAAAGPGRQVQTAQAQDRFTLGGLKKFIGILKTVLLVFGGVAIFVGAFTIFNTLSITVAQRTREFAMLRMVGAARRQVLGSVMLEALALGLGASAIGLAAGFGLAAGLNAVFAALDLQLPQAGTVFEARTAIVAMLVGTLVTLAAGFLPARRATKIAPVAALREADPAARRLRWPSRLVRAAASLLGRPAAAIGGSAGKLARRNAMRQPGRTAGTAAALMIGVMLVTAVTVVANGLRQETKGTLNDRIAASHVITAQDGFSPMDPDIARAAAHAPGVSAISALRQDGGRVAGNTEIVNGVDAATIAKVFDFEWEDGSNRVLSGLGADGAVVDDGWAKEHGTKVGDRITVTSAKGVKLPLVVRGIEKSPVLDSLGLGPITVSRPAFDRAFEAQRDRLSFVTTTNAAALERALAKFPDAHVVSKDGFIKDMTKGIDELLAVFMVLLALTVIVSLFGIVNTLVLSTFERTREIGMLRAVGMTRRQVRRMIRHESIITALLGAAMGIAAGLGVAALLASAFGDEGITFAIPVVSLVAFAGVAILAGVLAAILPARRAAGMDVLTALAYE
jgi:putative ABC transport system permease protein